MKEDAETKGDIRKKAEELLGMSWDEILGEIERSIEISEDEDGETIVKVDGYFPPKKSS